MRLWTAELWVRTPARDTEDAAFRLVTLAHPYHRTGHARRLYSVAGPVVWDGAASDAAVRDPARYGHGLPPGQAVLVPVGGLPHDRKRPAGDTERAQAADHAEALEFAGHGAYRTLPSTYPSESPWWQAWQRVSFLAGPGDAPARAAELAATVVDARGAAAAVVTGLEARDGRRDPIDGRLVHPACDTGALEVDALWDDFDAVEMGMGDAGEPVALAAVCLAAAREVRAEFGVAPARPVPAGDPDRCDAVSGRTEGDVPRIGP